MKNFFGRHKPKPVKVTSKDAPTIGVDEQTAPIYAQHATYAQPPRPAPSEHGHGAYPLPNHYGQAAARPSIDSDRWEVVDGREDQPLHHKPQPQQPYPGPYVPPPRALPPSREGSFSSSLPPGASPPIPSPLPRSNSPFSSASLKERDKAQQQALKKRPHANVALDILKSLDPPSHPQSQPHEDAAATQMRRVPSQEAYDVPSAQVLTPQPVDAKFSIRGVDPKQTIRLVGVPAPGSEPKKEKKGGLEFWERLSGKDRDKEKEREKEKERDRERDREVDYREREHHRDKDRERERERERDKNRDRERDRWRDREEEGQLTRMIGFLTATASEDWDLALEVCERASANEASAKEALRALRREFKYGEPTAQLSAARLWAIMLWNSNTSFIQQSMSRKFLDTLEHLITSSQTSPVVRERVLDVLAAAAYATHSKKDSNPKNDKDGFRGLWRKVKPADKPDEGVPLDMRDSMFTPPARPPRSSHQNDAPSPSPYPEVPPEAPRSPPVAPQPRKRRSLTRNRIIPPEEDMRRLMEECNIGRGNASLLSQALVFTNPEKMKKDQIIREFYAKCRASQELIYAQIPWASSGAERSRLAKEQQQALQNVTDTIVVPPPFDPENPNDKTPEERLLDVLLAANSELMEALQQYEDMEQIGREREAEYRSRKETRMDPRQLYQLDAGSYQSQGTGANSRPQSRSGSTSSSPPASIITSPPSGELPGRGGTIAQPYPRQPPSPPGFGSNFYTGSTTAIPQTLAPPPAAPHGPRSPAISSMHSRTPSPSTPANDLSQGTHQTYSGSNSLGSYRSAAYSSPVNDHGDDFHEGAPVVPSEKALGKRRVVEDDEPEKPFDPDDLYYDPKNEAFNTDNSEDSDQESENHGSRKWGHAPVNYVYDAAAERTKQRLEQANNNLLVNGVH